MKSVEVSARSVEEAIEEGLAKLDSVRDDVNISVLEEGSKGLFGLLGSRQARVRLEIKPTIGWKARAVDSFLRELLHRMDIDTEVQVEVNGDRIEVDITGENLGLLIGRRGQTLDSLQYIVGLVVNREGGDWVRVIVDVEGYRDRREETLRSLARRLAGKSTATGRRVALDPMNAMDRRIVHSELQVIDGVDTHSEGKDPYRRVIIVPKRSQERA